MNIKKIIYVITGCIGAGLGAVGAVVPLVQGNKALHGQSGGLCGRSGMTVKTKIRIMVTVTLLMSIGFIMMGAKGISPGMHRPGLRLGIPYHLLLLWGKDDSCGQLMDCDVV